MSFHGSFLVCAAAPVHAQAPGENSDESGKNLMIGARDTGGRNRLPPSGPASQVRWIGARARRWRRAGSAGRRLEAKTDGKAAAPNGNQEETQVARHGAVGEWHAPKAANVRHGGRRTVAAGTGCQARRQLETLGALSIGEAVGHGPRG